MVGKRGGRCKLVTGALPDIEHVTSALVCMCVFSIILSTGRVSMWELELSLS